MNFLNEEDEAKTPLTSTVDISIIPFSSRNLDIAMFDQNHSQI